MYALCAPHGGRICLTAGLPYVYVKLQQQETRGGSGMHVVAQICDAPLLNEATRSRLILQQRDIAAMSPALLRCIIRASTACSGRQ
jgi:hypothetical protein